MLIFCLLDSASPVVPPSSPPPALPPRSHVMNDGDQRPREEEPQTFFGVSHETPPPSPDVNNGRGNWLFCNHRMPWSSVGNILQ